MTLRQDSGSTVSKPLPARTIELLAPARDLACGLAAIDCGADAIYVGPPRFGARATVGNSMDDIERLVAHAHRFRARVYATVNTLLFDDEVSEAARLIRRLWDLGVDAAIVQDMALLEVDLPPIPLFASTQCDTRDAAKARFLEAVGFSRIILARELSLEQIRAIRAAVGVHLETFVHGALCAGHSGRCALSQAIGGRSANRGRCAQPCRLPWTLEDDEGRVVARDRPVLSMRDLDLSDHLGALVDAGVDSLKIEGRLKGLDYVRNVVAHYRQRLDEVLEPRGLRPASSGVCDPGFTPEPARSFNRGFTSFLLHGRTGPIGQLGSEGAGGEAAGVVVRAEGAAAVLDTPAGLEPGDGVCWVDEAGEVQGASVDRVEGSWLVLRDGVAPPAGTALWRNRSVAFERALHAARSERSIRVAVSILAGPSPGDRPVLHVTDEDGIEVRLPLPEGAPARDPEGARQTAARQLGRFGGTGFVAISVAVGFREVPFLPLSAWNALRREAATALEVAREASRIREEVHRTPSDAPYPETTLDFRGNVLNETARRFYIRHGVEAIEPAAESGLSLLGRVVMTTTNCPRRPLGRCPREVPGEGRARPWTLVGRDDHRHTLVFDCQHCVVNVIYRGR